MATSDHPRDIFIGLWNLVEAIEIDKEKTWYPWGKNAQGCIIYTPEGIMAVQIIPEEPNTTALPDHNIYFGPFELDEANNLVIHHIQAHMNPAMVGRKNIRSYHFYDNKLLLVTQGEPTTRRLLWEKAALATAK